MHAVTSATDFYTATNGISFFSLQSFDKECKITFLKDKTLISGFVTRIGDTVWDASVKDSCNFSNNSL